MFALLRFLHISAIRFNQIKQHSHSHVRVPCTLRFDKHYELCISVFIDDESEIVENILHEHRAERLYFDIFLRDGRVLGVQIPVQLKHIIGVGKQLCEYAVL